MKDFFRTLMRPDREENPEKSVVARAANVLQIGEFQLLQLAYQEWYGQDMPDYMSDRIFRAYMLHGEVPSWAKAYADRILRQDEIGLIDANESHYHRYDQEYVTHVPRGVGQFTFACLILATILAGTILVGHLAGYKATSVLPPFFEAEELSKDL